MLKGLFRFIIFPFLGMVLAGCQFYSKIEPPKPSINNEYLTKNQFVGNQTYTSFFSQFHDEDLIKVLSTALSNNQDLLEAIERISLAESLYTVAKSPNYPNIQLDIDAQRTRSSKSGFAEIQGTPFSVGVGQNKSVVTNIFIQALNLSWEIDFFGRIRNQKLRAEEVIKESIAFEKGVYLTLSADITNTYFSILAYHQLIALTKKQVNALNTIIDLKKSKYASGLDADQIVLNYEKKLTEFKQELLELEKSASIFQHHLAQLSGVEPSLFSIKIKPFRAPSLDELFCKIELPSEILKNRPDVIQAEHKLIQSGYSVKIATADLLPRFSILGAFGFANSFFPSWFTHDNSFWSLGPTARWPVFSGFSSLAQLNAEKSKQRQAALHYKSVVLKALEDVENCMVTFFNQEKSAQEAIHAVRLEKKILDSKFSLTNCGLDAKSTSIEETIHFLEEEKKVTKEQFKTIQSLIQLYKAIGGEWK